MKRAIIIILLAALCACDKVNPPASEQTGPRMLYVSPLGKDTDDGTFDSPMQTLNAVCTKLKAEAPDADVEVRCLSTAGTYWNQFTTWTYWNTAHKTTITSHPVGTRARFEMADSAGCTSPFFTFNAEAGVATNLCIENLLVLNYNAGAIYLTGSWPDESPVKWNGYNRISNCIFANIGNYNRPGLFLCFGVLDFVRSICNTVDGCIFYRCENERAGAPPIIGIYLAHGSRGNVIRNNLFRGIGGNTIKLRDGSNANLIEHNTFIRCGRRQRISANIISWYCDENLMDLDCMFTHEGASDSTIILNNVARGAFNCGLAVLWTDLMLILPPTAKCDPCIGDTSHVTISGCSIAECQVSDYAINDIPPY